MNQINNEKNNNMAIIDGEFKSQNSNETKKHDNDWKLELSALIGFCFSGAIFIASGIQNGDILTIIGSSVWILSCLVWMVPYKKYFDHSNDRPED